MEIDWDWIFQRPQILAVKLDDYFKVEVLYRYSFNRKNLKSKNKKASNMKKYIQLPKQNQIPFFSTINYVIRNIYSIRINIKKYEYIWISHPNLFSLIPDKYNGKIIYDCMDQYEDMEPEATKFKVRIEEDKLIMRADLIFCSSNYLYNKLAKKRGGNSNIFLIRNGYLESENYFSVNDAHLKSNYTFAYIGTIAEWFDFDSIKRSVECFDNINYEIIGPAINTTKIVNVNYRGIIPHSKLYENIQNVDCLIMPFIVNETVLAVDPVKLYEYISYGKCIISVYYPEISRFEPLVYFYNNSEEYAKLIKELMETGFKPKYDKKIQRDFLTQNSWEYRVDTINEKILNNI